MCGATDVPNVQQVQEKQFDGRNASTLCFNNPNYRNWLLGTVEDYARSWEIDGIMWGSERQGAFANAMRAVRRRRNPGNDDVLLRVLPAKATAARGQRGAGARGL